MLQLLRLQLSLRVLIVSLIDSTYIGANKTSLRAFKSNIKIYIGEIYIGDKYICHKLHRPTDLTSFALSRAVTLKDFDLLKPNPLTKLVKIFRGSLCLVRDVSLCYAQDDYIE